MTSRAARVRWVSLTVATVLAVALAWVLTGTRGQGGTSASVSSDGTDVRSAHVVTVVLRTGDAGDTGDAMARVIFTYSRSPGVVSAAGGQTVGRFNLGADATMADLATLESALRRDPTVATVRDDSPGAAPPLDQLAKPGATTSSTPLT